MDRHRVRAHGRWGMALMLGVWILVLACAPAARAQQPDSTRAPIDVALFRNTAIHFHADSSARYAQPGEVVLDKGRIVARRFDLPSIDGPHRVTALVTVRPIPKSEREVHDRWDRAGSLRLVTDGMPDIELVRFMTAYGGRTDWEVDVTHLAPLLRGARELWLFIDTWVSPAWRVDATLRYTPVQALDNPTWTSPLLFIDSYDRESTPNGEEASIDVPPGLARIVMTYLSTGHCTDGRDEDEFVSKANLISVDGVVVARVHPWRDDCRQYRERNPYTSRWTDGSWSSDYSRSGWCPGLAVSPLEFDLTDHLTPGKHVVRFEVLDVRPKNEDGNYGYWRLSASLSGWAVTPKLWQNY